MGSRESQHKWICLTSGDADGIGLEVSAKALLKIGPQRGTRFILFLSDAGICKNDLSLLKKLESKFRVEHATELSSVLSKSRDPKTSRTQLFLIHSSEPPAQWVVLSAKACLAGETHALCTAPLSKPGIVAAGFHDLGHTEILQRLCQSNGQVPHVNMCFIGKNFNVVLATGHLPLSQVTAHLSEETLLQSLENCEHIRRYLPAKIRRKPIAVLGLNPHSGDQGLIGDFEKNMLIPLLQKQRKFPVAGPLVPDVAFHPDNWDQYSFYLALYHDQGLIPFKMSHGFDSGVHLTLGLPICRTSVDHGTAKDIYGKDKANAGSMRDALHWAMRLAEYRN